MYAAIKVPLGQSAPSQAVAQRAKSAMRGIANEPGCREAHATPSASGVKEGAPDLGPRSLECRPRFLDASAVGWSGAGKGLTKRDRSARSGRVTNSSIPLMITGSQLTCDKARRTILAEIDGHVVKRLEIVIVAP